MIQNGFLSRPSLCQRMCHLVAVVKSSRPRFWAEAVSSCPERSSLSKVGDSAKIRLRRSNSQDKAMVDERARAVSGVEAWQMKCRRPRARTCLVLSQIHLICIRYIRIYVVQCQNYIRFVSDISHLPHNHLRFCSPETWQHLQIGGQCDSH